MDQNAQRAPTWRFSPSLDDKGASLGQLREHPQLPGVSRPMKTSHMLTGKMEVQMTTVLLFPISSQTHAVLASVIQFADYIRLFYLQYAVAMRLFSWLRDC